MAYISNSISIEITTELLVMMNRKSYDVSFGTIGFDLERSHRGQAYFKGRNLETLSDTAKFIINDG